MIKSFFCILWDRRESHLLYPLDQKTGEADFINIGHLEMDYLKHFLNIKPPLSVTNCRRVFFMQESLAFKWSPILLFLIQYWEKKKSKNIFEATESFFPEEQQEMLFSQLESVLISQWHFSLGTRRILLLDQNGGEGSAEHPVEFHAVFCSAQGTDQHPHNGDSL